MIRVLIVEDVPLFRAGLRMSLNQMGNCVVVGEATDPGDILLVARNLRPDVILLNQGLATAPAFDIACLLFQNELRGLLVLAEPVSEEQLFEYLRVGAAGYEGRWISAEDLAQKLDRISRGEYLISGEVLTPLPKEAPQTRRPGLAQLSLVAPLEALVKLEDCPLSARQLEILAYAARGMSNKLIAQALSICDQTVKNHMTTILSALGVSDRTAAVVEALRREWLVDDDNQPFQPRMRADQRQDSPALQQSEPRLRYRLQKAFCNKPGCRMCQAGTGHGPYWYVYESRSGRTVRRYIGKELPEGVSAN